jgi:hypothetical protein
MRSIVELLPNCHVRMLPKFQGIPWQNFMKIANNQCAPTKCHYKFVIFSRKRKSLAFRCIDRKREFIYKSEGRTHHAVQLDPRKRKNLD